MSLLPSLSAARPAFSAFVAMGVLWGAFAAVLPEIKAGLGVDEAQLGLLLFMTPISAALAMMIAPRVGAQLGRWALPLAVGVMALSFFLPGQTASVWLFPLAMLACGFGTGLTDVLMNARTAQAEQDQGLHLMNLCHAGYSFGYAGGAIATGILRGQGWGPGPLLALMAFVAMLTALGTLEREGTIRGLRRPEGGGASLGILPLIGGGIVMIAFLTENAAESWSALHIEQTLGGSPEQGAMGPAALALTMGVARILGQGLISRLNPFRLLMGGALVASCGALFAAGAVTPFMAYAGFVVMGIGASVIAPTAFSLVGRMAAPQNQARAVARASLFGYLGYFFGPPALGFLAGSFGLRAAFVFAAVVLLAVFVLAPLMARQAAQRA